MKWSKRHSKTLGVKDLLIAVLVICLIGVVYLFKQAETEREELKMKFSSALRATADNAKALQERLEVAMDMLSETPSSIPSPAVDSSAPHVEGSTVIIVFCYNRAEYLKRTLESLFTRLESSDADQFHAAGVAVIISQDGEDHAVNAAAKDFIHSHTAIKVEHIQHVRNPATSAGAYYALAQHYAKGLTHAFGHSSHPQRVIILEDDLELAVDFFSYFASFAPMLDRDENLLCVSAWNDHGQAKFINTEADSGLVYRSDFFPGLGWMMTRAVWSNELERKWPDSYWDDWLREPEQRKGRQCIRPAISRTITFGQSGGASQGQFFSQYLAPMQLNMQAPVQGFQPELLETQVFDEWFMQEVQSAVEINNVEDMVVDGTSYKLVYKSNADYEHRVAKMLGIIPDIKAGVPRGAYRGVVPLYYNHHRLFLAPQL